MKNFWSNFKEWIIIGLYFIFMGAFLGFGINFFVKEIDEKKDKIQELNIDQERKTKRLGELATLREQFEFVSREEGKIIEVFNKDNVVELIRNLEKIGSMTENKVSIEDISEVKAEKDNKSSSSKKEEATAILPGKGHLKARIKLEGEYNNLIKFIDKMENMEYHNDLVSLSVSGKEKKVQIGNPFAKEEEVIEPEKTSENLIESSLEAVFYIK